MGNDIVRDRDHINGKFRGYAHNMCNLQAKSNFVSYMHLILLIMITT